MTDLLYEKKNGVAYLTMNRPDSSNSFSSIMRERLKLAFKLCDDDSSVRSIVLQGRGANFMSGGDISNFKTLTETERNERKKILLGRIEDELNPLLFLMQKVKKPIIASVQGAVAGAGVGLILSCDLVICTDSSYLKLGYCGIGATPDCGITYNLPRVVGVRKASEMILLNEIIPAHKAYNLGLVNRVVKESELGVETMKLAERLADGPSRAFSMTKRLLASSWTSSLEQQLQSEAEAFATVAMSRDWEEGVKAFIEKRNPRFSGQ